MSKGGAHAAGMSPLQTLILNRMRERGWTPKQVEDRGVSHATLHRYMNPVALQQPPRKSVLRALANALDIPLPKMEQAAVESVGYDYTAGGQTPAGTTPAPRVTIEDAIESDPHLPEIAKAHLRSQVALLRHLREGLPPELAEEQQRLRDAAILNDEGRKIITAVKDAPSTARRRKP